MHVAMSVTGTGEGTLSSAGPVVYVNGEVVADGSISQTSSGTYAKLRAWFATFKDQANYSNNYIGMSQHVADLDYTGSLSDFRIYKAGLTQDEVIEVMCESLTDQDIVNLAKDKYLTFPTSIVTKDIVLPSSLMGGKVDVSWESSHPEVISNAGVVNKSIQSAHGITITAHLTRGTSTVTKSFSVSVLPEDLPPYTLTIDGKNEILDVSDVLYGLFYEDINNAADGGIYAELVQNRSFEAFAFDSYSHVCGEHGTSTGRNYTPLHAWSGDIEKVTVKNTGGLNDFFGIEDKDLNAHYVTVADGATINNRGFADSNQNCSMFIEQGAKSQI